MRVYTCAHTRADMPRSAFRHTYNCLATSDNTRTYNDGYHIVHHRNSKMHYLEMPQHFINTLDQHDDNDGEIMFWHACLLAFLSSCSPHFSCSTLPRGLCCMIWSAPGTFISLHLASKRTYPA